MRAVVQRVLRASVTVDGREVASIGSGLLVLLGVRVGDDVALARRAAGKVAALRIFEGDDGRMSRDVREAGGDVLCVSQFTLYGDVRRGNRPSFSEAAPGAAAEGIYAAFCEALREAGVRCEEGVFGAHMEVGLVNDGPVTILIDSADFERPRRASP